MFVFLGVAAVIALLAVMLAYRSICSTHMCSKYSNSQYNIYDHDEHGMRSLSVKRQSR